MRRMLFSAAAAMLLCLLLTGCSKQPLPAGMEEDAVIRAGQEIVTLLVAGDYDAAAETFREDVDVSGEALRTLTENATGKLGEYRERVDAMAEGHTVDGVDYAQAALLCKYKKGNALYRIIFDTEMTPVGIEITEK